MVILEGTLGIFPTIRTLSVTLRHLLGERECSTAILSSNLHLQSMNLKHFLKKRERVYLLWEISCNPREKDWNAERVTGTGLGRKNTWIEVLLSNLGVIFMFHFSINFLFSRTTILFPGRKFSSLWFLFLAACFMKQTLWRGDGDKNVPSPAISW